jgi:hypothetical protein
VLKVSFQPAHSRFSVNSHDANTHQDSLTAARKTPDVHLVVSAQFLAGNPLGKRPSMAAFPRIGRRQLAAFPRVGKRQQRLLATFPRIGRSGFPNLENAGSRIWQPTGAGSYRLKGQDETYADYANNKGACEFMRQKSNQLRTFVKFNQHSNSIKRLLS